MNPLKVARTVALTGAGAVGGAMIAAEKNDTGFNYTGQSAGQTFLGAGIGAMVGGVGIPVAGSMIKRSVIGRIR